MKRPKLNIVKPHNPRQSQIARKYSFLLGSGWFWCHGQFGWIVCYIDAVWGAKVDGLYISTDNFDDVVGPLDYPKEPK